MGPKGVHPVYGPCAVYLRSPISLLGHLCWSNFYRLGWRSSGSVCVGHARAWSMDNSVHIGLRRRNVAERGQRNWLPSHHRNIARLHKHSAQDIAGRALWHCRHTLGAGDDLHLSRCDSDIYLSCSQISYGLVAATVCELRGAGPIGTAQIIEGQGWPCGACVDTVSGPAQFVPALKAQVATGLKSRSGFSAGRLFADEQIPSAYFAEQD